VAQNTYKIKQETFIRLLRLERQTQRKEKLREEDDIEKGREE
jgi:hypothetical protein